MEFSVGESPLRPLLGQKNLTQNIIGFRLTFATILDFIKKSLCFSAKPFDVLQKTFDLVGKSVRFVDKKFLFAKKSKFSPQFKRSLAFLKKVLIASKPLFGFWDLGFWVSGL